MDEFNDVQQEQHFDFGEKKNTTRKTIKRTLLAIGLALAVYMVYSIVHLFLCRVGQPPCGGFPL